ncbi:MAG: carotenoid oxygenase family protein [Proteobacteria bacterium]|nr:carotenoid oxygenase family protein [Pseudomonadota bacterium]
MASSANAQHPRTAASWAGLWDTIPETQGAAKAVQGAIPEGLVGTLYRNGPGRHDFASSFFDGDGLIRAVEIQPGGEARYRARYVRTKKYVDEVGSSRMKWRLGGTNLPGGPLRNLFKPPAHEANTSIFPFGGRLWALEEGGHPYEIDPETLETGVLEDFEGQLSPRTAFSAHPHVDPHTGETFSFGTHFGSKPLLKTFRVDQRGRLRHIGEIPLRAASFVHDYALSQKWMAFFIPPLVANIWKFLLGIDSFFGSIRYRPENGTRIALMSRDGGEPIFLETDACMIGHTVSAWDEGDELVVDLCQQEGWEAIGDAAANFRTSDWAGFGAGSVVRYRVDPARRRVHKETLSELPAEFPRIHPALETERARYAYCATNTHPGEGGFYRALVKLDRESGDHQLCDFGTRKAALEPIFVPKPDARAEDEGWVLAFVHDAEGPGTDLVVLDAQHVADGPVCTLQLPQNAGVTFHGCWIPGA